MRYVPVLVLRATLFSHDRDRTLGITRDQLTHQQNRHLLSSIWNDDPGWRILSTPQPLKFRHDSKDPTMKDPSSTLELTAEKREKAAALPRLQLLPTNFYYYAISKQLQLEQVRHSLLVILLLQP